MTMTAADFIEGVRIVKLSSLEWPGHLQRLSAVLQADPELRVDILALARQESEESRNRITSFVEALDLSRDLMSLEALTTMMTTMYPVEQIPLALKFAKIDNSLHGFLQSGALRTPADVDDYLRFARKTGMYASKTAGAAGTRENATGDAALRVPRKDAEATELHAAAERKPSSIAEAVARAKERMANSEL